MLEGESKQQRKTRQKIILKKPEDKFVLRNSF